MPTPRTTSRRALVAIITIALTLLLSTPAAVAKGGKGGGGGGGGGGSTPVPEQHYQWRVTMPGSVARSTPSVAADGTIYAVDAYNNLVAVAPDGTVKWSATEAGSSGLDLGADGTIYVGNEDWIKAYNPDGTLKWTFTQTPRAFTFPDLAVGPDGNIYAIGTSGMGVFSLSDEGDHAALRWQVPEPYGRPIVSNTEMEFGPTSDGLGHQLYFAANGHVRALRISDGSQVFLLGGGSVAPRVSPFDGTWRNNASAADPDGVHLWTADLPLFAGSYGATIGASGDTYLTVSGVELYSVDPAGNTNWTTGYSDVPGPNLREFLDYPAVDPAESLVLIPVGSTSAMPGAVRAASTSNGQAQWRTEFPPSPNGLEQFVSSQFAFSPDGSTAYVMTTNAGGVDAHSYLNAIRLDPSAPSASTLLRSLDISFSYRHRNGEVTHTATVLVTDENLGPISGATVDATWTLADGTTITQSTTTSGRGEATFKASGVYGTRFILTIDNISLSGFTFDPIHSELVGYA